jgi:hypothetical protein
LVPLYDGVSEWLKTAVPQGWEAWMITSSKPLSLRIRLQTKTILEFKNGALDCRLLGYDIRTPLADLAPDAIETPVAETTDEPQTDVVEEETID